MRAIVLIAFALGLAAPALAATMYKWKDEKGVTHFSEDPPPDGKAQKIDVTPVPPSSQVAPKPDNWREREADYRRKQNDKAREDEKSKREAATRESRCLSAQRDLAVLNRERPVYTVNKRGEKVYVDDSERAAQVEAAKKSVEANCR